MLYVCIYIYIYIHTHVLCARACGRLAGSGWNTVEVVQEYCSDATPLPPPAWMLPRCPFINDCTTNARTRLKRWWVSESSTAWNVQFDETVPHLSVKQGLRQALLSQNDLDEASDRVPPTSQLCGRKVIKFGRTRCAELGGARST